MTPRLMLIMPSEDGPYIRFYKTTDAMMSDMGWDENPETAPGQWLTLAEAEEDSNYWPANSAFLAKVEPMELGPEQTVVTYKLVPQEES